MWILYSSIIFLIIGIDGALTPSDDIIVQCASCKTDFLEGEVGGTLVVRYLIKVEKYTLLIIHYDNKNGTTNNIKATYVTGKVNKEQVNDRRFDIPEKTTKIDGGWALNITLNGLTMDDNSLEFRYDFMDENAKAFEGTNKVTVNAPPEFTRDIQFEDSYDVYENKSKNISFSMKGNPRPNVTAKMGDDIFPVVVKNLKPYTYNYSVTVNLEKKHCGHKMTVTAVSVTGETTMNVIFKPDSPSIIEAHINISKCLTVKWGQIESGACPAVYTLKYNETILISNIPAVEYHNCTGFNTSTSTTVAVKASVRGYASEFSQLRNVTVDVPTTSKPVTAKTDKSTGGGSEADLPDWAIIVIAVGAFVVLLIIVLVVLICCGVIRCACCGESKGKRNTRTKPTTDEERRVMKAKSSKGDTSFTVIFQNIHNRSVKLIWKDFNGEESFVQGIDSKKDHMEKAYITYAFIARDASDNQLLYFTDNKKTDIVYEGIKFGALKDETYNILITSKSPADIKKINGTTNPRYKHDNTEMKPIEGDYEYVSSRAKASKPESEYSDVNDFAKPQNPSAQQMDYAELGPGGRTGEKPAVKESNYAQVNPDAAYYPPLNPENKQPPIYAVSSKPKKKRSPEPPYIDDGNSIVV